MGTFEKKRYELDHNNYRVVEAVVDRNAIPAVERYEMLQVGIEDDGVIYTLTGGLTDSDWHILYEPPLGNPAADGYVLVSTAAGVRSWVSQTGGMVYPGAGIPISTGSGWSTSLNAANLTSLAGLSYVSLSFVKMSASGTFSLDTATYDTSGTASGLISTHESTYNHINYNTAYTHSQVTSGNPHQVTYAELGGTQPAPITHSHAWSDITSGVPANLTSLAGLTYVSAAFVKMTGAGTFTLDTVLYEPALGNPATDGYVLSSTALGVRSWVAMTGGTYNSGSGITIDGTNNIDLGGALDTAAIITSVSSQLRFDMDDGANFSTRFSIGQDYMEVSAYNSTGFTGNRDFFSLFRGTSAKMGWVTGVTVRQIETGSTNIQITDSVSSKGMVYAGNYATAGTADDRWIPDYGAVKAYADSVGGGGYWSQTTTNIYPTVLTNWVGLGTATPNKHFHIYGTTANDIAQFDIGLDFDTVTRPASITGVPSTGTELEIGNYYYNITFTTAIGETEVRTSAIITTTSGNQRVTLTIPVSSDYRVTGRKIYRTKVGGGAYIDYLLTTIADNTTTEYIDSIADTALTGSSGQGYYRDNTTNQFITVDGVAIMNAGVGNTFFGYAAGASITFGGRNTFFGRSAGTSLTIGRENTFIGNYAGDSVTEGSASVIIGNYAGAQITTSGGNVLLGTDAGVYGNQSGNVAVGMYALGSVSTATPIYNTVLGYYAGRYLVGSRNIIIGVQAGYGTNDLTTSIGAYNIYIGYQTGYNHAGGDYNLIIGHNMDVPTPASDYQFALGCDDRALLSGDMTSASEWVGSEYEFRVDTLDEFTASNGITSNVVITAPNFALSSDPRLKMNERLIVNGLELIDHLNPIYYDWIDNRSGQQEVGFFSTNVKRVHPSLVNIDRDGFETVNYIRMPVINTAAIKELKEKVLLLEKEVRELKANGRS